MEILKTWTSVDGQRRCELIARESGLFSFSETVLALEDMSHTPVESFHYWKPVHDSGYYATLGEAENEAISNIPWLEAMLG